MQGSNMAKRAQFEPSTAVNETQLQTMWALARYPHQLNLLWWLIVGFSPSRFLIFGNCLLSGQIGFFSCLLSG
jgi:hypothetical protein